MIRAGDNWNFWGTIRPDGIAYNRPWSGLVPQGYYESMWTFQYLDDYGGVFPDFQVIICVDPVPFAIGGIFTYVTSMLTRDLYVNMRAEPEYHRNLAHRFHRWWESLSWSARSKIANKLRTYMFLRHAGRFFYGGILYVGIRAIVSFCLLKTGIHEETFFSCYVGAGAYALLWQYLYSEKTWILDVICGSYAAIPMALADYFYGLVGRLQTTFYDGFPCNWMTPD